MNRFRDLLDAFHLLSDPERRAQHDTRYQGMRDARWQIFDQESTVSDVEADRKIRVGILSALYAARRNDNDRPGMGVIDLERLLECPEEHMKFHIWYLRENGLVQRQENGTLAVTAAGVDRVLDLGGPVRAAHLLTRGAEAPDI